MVTSDDASDPTLARLSLPIDAPGSSTLTSQRGMDAVGNTQDYNDAYQHATAAAWSADSESAS